MANIVKVRSYVRGAGKMTAKKVGKGALAKTAGAVGGALEGAGAVYTGVQIGKYAGKKLEKTAVGKKIGDKLSEPMARVKRWANDIKGEYDTRKKVYAMSEQKARATTGLEPSMEKDMRNSIVKPKQLKNYEGEVKKNVQTYQSALSKKGGYRGSMSGIAKSIIGK